MRRRSYNNATLFDGALKDHKVFHEFDELKNLIDWKRIEAMLVEGIRYSGEGAMAYSELAMFQVIVLQTMHAVSDVQMEKMLVRDLLFRRFCGFSLYDTTPDHSTISRFRKRLVDNNLYASLLEEVNKQLSERGLIIKEGSVSIVDASVIEAHQCRPKPGRHSDNTQDLEAGTSVKTGTKGRKEYTYGYKAHTNVDEDGFVKKVTVTAGNVHDSKQLEPVLTGDESEVYADKAYYNKKTEKLLKEKGVRSRILRKAVRNRPLSKEEKTFNRLCSGVRAGVERVFGSLKRHMKMDKTRFLGRERTHLWVTCLCIVHNLKKGAMILRTTRD